MNAADDLTAPQPGQELPPARVRALIGSGAALPLLPDHLPVPVRIGDQWWHLRADEADSHTAGYVVAPPAAAAAYERLARRVAAAATAVAAAPP